MVQTFISILYIGTADFSNRTRRTLLQTTSKEKYTAGAIAAYYGNLDHACTHTNTAEQSFVVGICIHR